MQPRSGSRDAVVRASNRPPATRPLDRQTVADRHKAAGAFAGDRLSDQRKGAGAKGDTHYFFSRLLLLLVVEVFSVVMVYYIRTKKKGNNAFVGRRILANYVAGTTR